jgi:hypothetical protein
LHLESDADEQLLLYIPFTQVIKLYSIAIKGPEDEGKITSSLFIHIIKLGYIIVFLKFKYFIAAPISPNKIAQIRSTCIL